MLLLLLLNYLYTANFEQIMIINLKTDSVNVVFEKETQKSHVQFNKRFEQVQEAKNVVGSLKV